MILILILLLIFQVKIDERKHSTTTNFTSRKQEEIIRISIEHELGTFHLPQLARDREIESFIDDTNYGLLSVDDAVLPVEAIALEYRGLESIEGNIHATIVPSQRISNGQRLSNPYIPIKQETP